MMFTIGNERFVSVNTLTLHQNSIVCFKLPLLFPKKNTYYLYCVEHNIYHNDITPKKRTAVLNYMYYITVQFIILAIMM